MERPATPVRIYDTDEIVRLLRERIASHDLAPGSKLRENELTKEFGVSRTAIREVFTALELRGVIDRIPNRGAVVARLDPDEVFELYDVREVLEALAYRLATQNAPERTWDDLVERFRKPMQASIDDGDLENYRTAIEELNDRMLQFVDNRFLRDMLDLIREKTLVVARRVMILPDRLEKGLVMHRKLLEAMAAGDGAAAERRYREIMTTAHEALRRYKDFVF
ncbi:MAG: GntR family transcriptional regulator [Alphaproteobacteria bacterium]